MAIYYTLMKVSIAQKRRWRMTQRNGQVPDSKKTKQTKVQAQKHPGLYPAPTTDAETEFFNKRKKRMFDNGELGDNVSY